MVKPGNRPRATEPPEQPAVKATKEPWSVARSERQLSSKERTAGREIKKGAGPIRGLPLIGQYKKWVSRLQTMGAWMIVSSKVPICLDPASCREDAAPIL